MKRARGGRRHVLQLDDNKESYLARYGYSRTEDEDSRGTPDNDEEINDEVDQSTQSTPEHLPGSTNGLQKDPGAPDIDDKVANFLAEIDALAPEDEEDLNSRPSFKTEVEIPPPTFQLNPNQQPFRSGDEAEKVQETKPKSNGAKSAYSSMFVKGGSEFVREKTEAAPATSMTTDVEWPEEPTTVWQQTLDDNTQCHYYWNTVTNEVTWEIPPEFTAYLLKYREYEETVARLKKEGKVKPPPKKSAEISTTRQIPETTKSSIANIPVPQQSEVDVSSSTEIPTAGKQSKSSAKSKSKSEESVLPDSSNSKGKQPKLVAYFGGSSDESATDSSKDSDSSDEEDRKKKAKKRKKKAEQVEDEESLDIDDIDKALDVALEKKTTDKSKSLSMISEKGESSKDRKSDKEPKSKSLVDALKETIQKKQEVEARRKAAIEEMMARELERRVGPPRRRPTPEEPSLHSGWDNKKKVMDYEHGRKRKRSEEYEHSLSRTDREGERESRHKHEERKKHKKDDKDRDRRKEKEESKRKDKDEHSKKKDRHDDKRRDEKKKHKDRDRDREKEKEDRKKDKKKDKERDSEEKKIKEEMKDEKIHEEEQKDEVNEEVKEKEEVIKEEVEEEESEDRKNDEMKELEGEKVKLSASEEKLKAIELANMKLEASELAELALSKMEFLEVTKKGLSKLQILLIELETRQQDWQGGGLSTEYFLVKLEEANRQLQQYEQSAAPPGWSCHWDRAYRRYFYMNKRSGKTQWDYPDDEEEEEEMEIERKEPYLGAEADQNPEHSSSGSPLGEENFDTGSDGNKPRSDPAHPAMEDMYPTISSESVTTQGEQSVTSEGAQKKSSKHHKSHHRHHREHRDVSHSASSERSSQRHRRKDRGDTADQHHREPQGDTTDTEQVSSSTSATTNTSESVPADTTAFYVAQNQKDIAEQEDKGVKSDEEMLVQETEPVSQSSYDYNSLATASVLQGQPPPPGTDLELLLSAPPPPPPPEEDRTDQPTESSTVSDSMYSEASAYRLYSDSSFTNSQAVNDGYGATNLLHRNVDGSYLGSEGVEEPSTSTGVLDQSNALDSEAPPIEVDPAVIARPPQVISRDPQVFSEPSQSVDSVLPSGEHSSMQGEETQASGSGDATSSGSYSEKKKKKKDKSMSSSNLTLKKKHVSTLVQKWQKVKKEVEIEEKNREEREQAIRQKLEEMKQDY